MILDPNEMILSYVADTNGTINHKQLNIETLLDILKTNNYPNYPDFTNGGLTPDIALPDPYIRMIEHMKQVDAQPLSPEDVTRMRETQTDRLLAEQSHESGWKSHLAPPMTKISITELTPDARLKRNAKAGK